MRELRFFYDSDGDVLYISFVQGRKGSTVSLNDNIILRFDAQTGEALGLTLLDFSRLVQVSGSLPLSRLEEFPPELRNLVKKILSRPPVNLYLEIAPSPDQAGLVASVRSYLPLAELVMEPVTA